MDNDMDNAVCEGRPLNAIVKNARSVMEDAMVLDCRMRLVGQELSERIRTRPPRELDVETGVELRGIKDDVIGTFDKVSENLCSDAQLLSAAVENMFKYMRSDEDNFKLLKESGYVEEKSELQFNFVKEERLESGVTLRTGIWFPVDFIVNASRCGGSLTVLDDAGEKLFSTRLDEPHVCSSAIRILEAIARPWKDGWVDIEQWKRKEQNDAKEEGQGIQGV